MTDTVGRNACACSGSLSSQYHCNRNPISPVPFRRYSHVTNCQGSGYNPAAQECQKPSSRIGMRWMEYSSSDPGLKMAKEAILCCPFPSGAASTPYLFNVKDVTLKELIVQL